MSSPDYRQPTPRYARSPTYSPVSPYYRSRESPAYSSEESDPDSDDLRLPPPLSLTAPVGISLVKLGEPVSFGVGGVASLAFKAINSSLVDKYKCPVCIDLFLGGDREVVELSCSHLVCLSCIQVSHGKKNACPLIHHQYCLVTGVQPQVPAVPDRILRQCELVDCTQADS
jgi:hypothetical protein